MSLGAQSEGDWWYRGKNNIGNDVTNRIIANQQKQIEKLEKKNQMNHSIIEVEELYKEAADALKSVESKQQSQILIAISNLLTIKNIAIKALKKQS